MSHVQRLQTKLFCYTEDQAVKIGKSKNDHFWPWVGEQQLIRRCALRQESKFRQSMIVQCHTSTKQFHRFWWDHCVTMINWSIRKWSFSNDHFWPQDKCGVFGELELIQKCINAFKHTEPPIRLHWQTCQSKMVILKWPFLTPRSTWTVPRGV